MATIASFRKSVVHLVFAGLTLATLAGGVEARDWFRLPGSAASKDTVALSELPKEGQRTYQTILDGGPFRHGKDGTVFGNRERLLPAQRRGHYREYTVETAGSRDRGARRIVCGGPPRTPQACWYTADHYASFKRIEP